MNNQSTPPRTDSLWDTLWQARYWYSGVFLLIAIPSEIIVITGEISRNQGIINTWRNLLGPSEAAMATSFGAAFMLTEGAKLTMVLAHGAKKIIDNWFEKRERKFREREEKLRAEILAKGLEEGRAKGRAEGRTEGRAQERQAWQEWNTRREEAEARGEPFTEPPPNR